MVVILHSLSIFVSCFQLSHSYSPFLFSVESQPIQKSLSEALCPTGWRQALKEEALSPIELREAMEE